MTGTRNDPVQAATAGVLAALARAGLLLQQDKHALNVVTLITGETLRTSWWSHPKAQLIFAVLSRLDEHADVLLTKLLQGKVTLVHRSLWPAVLAVASGAEPWQTAGISKPARRLLTSIDEAEHPIRHSGPVVKELESRLLAHAQEIHTESGKHEIVLQPWSMWAREARVKPLRSVVAAKQQLEEAAQAIGATVVALPWRTR
ncbi:MAG TPA: hypothetical protein VGQ36_20390 [Thermoanaerobaculia bacterium]|jgi:hypothetical protein|nr:hypothetical protein [Thermoanaerobaculia bacterium]